MSSCIYAIANLIQASSLQNHLILLFFCRSLCFVCLLKRILPLPIFYRQHYPNAYTTIRKKRQSIPPVKKLK
ncbi:hypothetical protein CW304_29495 [Bacillus sp. UFRGS-B20]|nr:hypothetical protein CW304_29495 [Bacillus sp. UFRGS-B20]